MSFWVLSELEFLNCHNWNFRSLTFIIKKFKQILKVNILVFLVLLLLEFCHKLSLSFIKSLVFSFVTIWFFQFCYFLSFFWSFWALSEFEFLSVFIFYLFNCCHGRAWLFSLTIWVFDFLTLMVLSQFSFITIWFFCCCCYVSFSFAANWVLL